MKTYKPTPATASDAEIGSITCDVCGKTYRTDKDFMEIQEFVCLDFYGGYGSVFGDMSHCTLDICQHCLKKKLGKWIVIKQEGEAGWR